MHACRRKIEGALKSVCARAPEGVRHSSHETNVRGGKSHSARTPLESESESESKRENVHAGVPASTKARARARETKHVCKRARESGTLANTCTHLATAKLYAHSAVFTLFARDFANLAIVMRCFRQPCIACGIGETQHARCMRASNCCEDSCRRLKRVNDQYDDTEIMLQVRVYACAYMHCTYDAHGSPCNPARFCVHLSTLDGSLACFWTK